MSGQPPFFETCRHAMQKAGLSEGAGIFAPICPVEIDCQEPAGFVRQQRIDADCKTFTRSFGWLPPQEVASNYLLENGDELTLIAMTALRLRFRTNAGKPLIPTIRLLAALPRLPVLSSRSISQRRSSLMVYPDSWAPGRGRTQLLNSSCHVHQFPSNEIPKQTQNLGSMALWRLSQCRVTQVNCTSKTANI